MAYVQDAGSEGDPVNLAIQRTATFANRKIFMISTPTIKYFSRIESAFDEGDKRYFFVPCPKNLYQNPWTWLISPLFGHKTQLFF